MFFVGYHGIQQRGNGKWQWLDDGGKGKPKREGAYDILGAVVGTALDSVTLDEL